MRSAYPAFSNAKNILRHANERSLNLLTNDVIIAQVLTIFKLTRII